MGINGPEFDFGFRRMGNVMGLRLRELEGIEER